MTKINITWYLRAAGDWALIIGSIATALWANNILVYIAAAIIIGSRQFALSVLGHDAAHGHAGPFSNVSATVLCFWPMGIGLDAFRSHHWLHHRGVGITSDPELPHRQRSERAADYFGVFKLAALDLIGYGIPQVLRLFYIFRPTRPLDVLGPALFTLLFIWLAPWPVIIIWYAALLTSFSATFRLRGHTEHRGTATFHKTQPPLWQRAWYLPHGTWLHWEHHRWPALPIASQLKRHRAAAIDRI